VSGARERVRIRYLRPPDRLQTFEQEVAARLPGGCVVTLLEAAELARPVEVEGRAVLEPGAPVVWFTYPGAWHDIGRFHLRDGTFTGIYANVLTPVRMEGLEWETTDLFLDLWQPADGPARLLDEEELLEAEREGWVSPVQAARAREEGARLLDAALAGSWPPPEVAEWTRERAGGPR
jgi:predicted RNA-binding protein associated with RNAse of E/G family